MDKKIIIALGLLVLLAGGVFWCTVKRQKESVVTDPLLQSNQQGETKTFESVKGEEGYVWFPVPELGIEIKVKKDIAGELIYKVQKAANSNDPNVSVQFTTKKLLDIADKLYQKKVHEDGYYNCSIGFFGGYMAIPKDFDDDEVYGYQKGHGVKIEESFIWYISPQSNCVSDQNSEDAQYENTLLNWWGRPTSEYTETRNLFYHLQKAVRKIRN